jgi:hypothetical protein
MSLRRKDFRCELDAELHEWLTIIAEFEARDISDLGRMLLEKTIVGESLRYERLGHRALTIGGGNDSAEAQRAGFVYVIQIGDRYKIGKAEDWRKRLSNAMFPAPPRVVCVIETDDRHELEQTLHRRYSEMRTHGEWFSLALAQVEELKNHPGASVPI